MERAALNEVFIVELVKTTRGRCGRIGTRKLLNELREDFANAGIKLGRDGLHEILVRNHLTIKPVRRSCRTTISFAWLNSYTDLRRGLAVQGSELMWCADITYVRIEGGFVYLSLITDEYSRKIVGWCCHDTLEAEGCVVALKMALTHRRYLERKLIHHSDRGVQYLSVVYTSLLGQHHISISTTQSGNPKDNPLAESMNGQLKTELGLNATFATFEQAHVACAEAVEKYNRHRPHGSLDYQTPEAVYDKTEPLKARWSPPEKAKRIIQHTRTVEEAVNLLQDEMAAVNYPPDYK